MPTRGIAQLLKLGKNDRHASYGPQMLITLDTKPRSLSPIGRNLGWDNNLQGLGIRKRKRGRFSENTVAALSHNDTSLILRLSGAAIEQQ